MKEVLINAGAGETRVAIVENGRLEELFLERSIGIEDNRDRSTGRAGHSLIGTIILGRVQRVLPGMQAAFVDLGLDKAGFLGAREARCLAGLPGFEEGLSPKISDCVREGEDILVQIVKDPIGEKGARISANITIPGRLSVLVPNQPGIALSRRIEDEDERSRLTALGEQMIAQNSGNLVENAGYIFRTNAIGLGLSDLIEDAERLAQIWLPILEQRRHAKSPAILHRDLDPVERIMRDEVSADIDRVLIDDGEALRAARDYCRQNMPDADQKLGFFSGPGPLFDLYEIETEIELLRQRRVPLKSGGWITIEGTEALTAIDVNSGSYTTGSGLEDTSVQVNLEAAEEIGRQLRLRGIGGLIVVDFIHIAEAENIEKVLAMLASSLAKDRTPTQLLPMSEFGLVEITRKRIRDPLIKLITETCRPCHGLGRSRTRDSVALDVLRAVEREAIASPGKPIHIRASPEVIDWIMEHEAEIRPALMRRGAARVSFEARQAFTREGFDVSPLA